MRPFAFATLLLCSTAVVAAPPVPVSELARQIDIPFERFVLKNGLRVVVHTDRKAPVVGVQVWYGVGSKDEPAGKTGFAHLFEHLMFNGTENAPEDFFVPLAQVGATDSNGATTFDRTWYYETVPTNALDLALFLESDRMGHLLGAVTQAKLDNQRSVVQNEKREGDNQPYGLAFYDIIGTIFPKGHPYHHLPIGSMADLDAASLDDVKSWFRTNYGPNNAVLVLAGDIDAKRARPLVDKWFGDIPRGPAVVRPRIETPTLPAPVSKVLKDRVATTRLYRVWAIPGMLDSDAIALDAAAGVLGGLSSSRLDNALVRKEQIAVSVSAGTDTYKDIGYFIVSADVRPGADAAQVGKRLDALIADFRTNGPSADELSRYATRGLSGVIGGLETVGGGGGKAAFLAQGELQAGDAGYYKKELARFSQLTPSQVKTAAQKWLSRPVYSLTIEPGERGAYSEAGSAAPKMVRDTEFYLDEDEAPSGIALSAVDRSKFPAVGPAQQLDFPAIERTTLTNGIPVYFARRAAVPKVQVQVSFDVGYAADPRAALGTQALMLSTMDEGTATRNSIQIAEEQERLGASVSSGASLDRTVFSLSALSANLAPSLDLLADIVRNPKFDPAEVNRVRNQQLARIASELTQPGPLAARLLPVKLYGPAHPYGIPASGLGDASSVKALTPADLREFHRRSLRPDTARIFAVGNTSLAQLRPLLDQRFGKWPSNRMARPVKDFSAAIPAPSPRIYLIDRPNSPQSVVVAGHVLAAKGRDDLVTLRAANEILGGDFLSRLNTDLRETKGWAYGVRTGVSPNENDIAISFSAPVQADRTGDTIRAFQAQVADFLKGKGVTAKELDRVVSSSTRELPGSFETSSEVLAGMIQIVNFDRPDDYYETLPQKYRALNAATLDATARAKIDPAKFIYVVVGDAKKVRPQLDALGLPVEDVPTPAAR